ncbi:phage major capsid protein [Gracilibacillus salitolerans]|uniref:Phage major capsid protein n=1 Tax=Gracilibacillus salitolerans TaxID=2663022 RepID=A0A5Q2TJN4_9BACI|nr:phage major capsid protein [Gracilibacillus salitolerans]QGH35139.1 phage major capsid protein [Gracilibacillus salitolerans]
MAKSKALLRSVQQRQKGQWLRLNNLQYFGGKKTLFEYKQNMTTIGQQLQKVEDELADAAIDTSKSTEDIQALQKSRDDLKQRFDVIKEQHDQIEAEQRAKFEQQENLQTIKDPKQKVIEAKAEMVRSTMTGKPISNDVRQALGDNTDPSTGGEKLLPKTVSNQLIHEPFVKNPLRDISVFTQETNLEIPKIAFQLDDDSFIGDTETAKEMKATGDSVTFGRHKFKVFVPISETVLNGSATNLVATVDQALESGLSAKEKKVAFATTPATGEEHMSFYSTQNAIKEVNGESKYKAIKAAIADLHEDFRDNAKVVMRYVDYMDIIEVLANGNASLYGAQPEQVLGVPTEFVDAATDPIVGDFAYSHFNYDLQMLRDRDKDVKTGVELFVLTAWLDHQIKLKSAFRIAKVSTEPEA